jgi:hypothetical protein
MRLIGFSTGALAYSDFRKALSMLNDEGVIAVELSALRMSEWFPFLTAIDEIDVSQFSYVSVHLPSSMNKSEERAVVDSLKQSMTTCNWPLILHPDAVTDWALWRALGSTICVENMDTRKPIGRTERELELVFEKLPEARFCFDIGHALQVDTTMGEAYRMLKQFGDRLVQVHVSEVNSRSKHDVLSYTTIESFQEVAHMISNDVPIILETPVEQSQMRLEIAKARFALPAERRTTLVT